MSKNELKRKRAIEPIELRYMSNANARFELRQTNDGGSVISGYAALFAPSRTDMGNFIEVLAPTCFDASLNSNADVRALWNHNPDHVLGRTKSGTLRLSKDSRGLLYEAQLPNTTLARDLAETMRRGDVDQSSYGFVVADESWEMDSDGIIVRTLLSVNLFDVSPVTYPANPNTVSKVRALFPNGDEHIRESIASLRGQPVVTRDDDDGDPSDPDSQDVLQGIDADDDDDDSDDELELCSCRCERCVMRSCQDCYNTRCTDRACRGAGCNMPAQDEARADALRIAQHFHTRRSNLYL